jgi:hypothetical protein
MFHTVQVLHNSSRLNLELLEVCLSLLTEPVLKGGCDRARKIIEYCDASRASSSNGTHYQPSMLIKSIGDLGSCESSIFLAVTLL